MSLISAIIHCCEDSPRKSLEQACALLSHQNDDAQTVLPKLTGILAKETLTRLKQGLKGTSTTSRELALALRSTSTGIELGKGSPDIHLVWTGPDTPTISPRDTLAQMLEMIGQAKESILLVTFAAFKATRIMKALEAAFERGVKLMVIVETAGDSGGQLSCNASNAFPKSLLASGCMWIWPIAKRPRNGKGKPGKLHAKCLVVDNANFLVSSANLTDDAMERNIEIGLRCFNPRIASDIRGKFLSLAKSCELIQLSSND